GSRPRKPTELPAARSGTIDGFVSVLPAQASVFTDSEFSVEVHIDFTADPTIGGGFDIAFDDTRLAFAGWEAADVGDPDFRRPPDVGAGVLRGFAVGDFDGITGPATVGTLRFVALEPADTAIDASATALDFVGPWVSLSDFTAQEVEYTGAQVAITLEPGPRIELAPGSVDFGGVAAGSVAQRSVVATNVGDMALTVGAVGAVDGLAPPFALIGDDCSLQVLLPAEQCTLDVEFAPGSISEFGDSFDLPSDAIDFPSVSVSVSGSSFITPELTILPPAHAFLDVPLGGSGLQDFALRNSGGALLTIGTIDAAALTTPFRLETDNCSGATLPPGNLCLIVVRYSPLEPAVLSEAEVVVPSTDPLRPTATIAIQGTPAPAVETDVFGKTSGLATPAHRVVCTNRTSGQQVEGRLPTIKGWNCRDLGLEAAEGDRIDVLVQGVAE
ncbi:MAG: choice-of-anchor D domain-containing protein, partial [Pseudomonadota bacterium]